MVMAKDRERKWAPSQQELIKAWTNVYWPDAALARAQEASDFSWETDCYFMVFCNHDGKEGRAAVCECSELQHSIVWCNAMRHHAKQLLEKHDPQEENKTCANMPFALWAMRKCAGMSRDAFQCLSAPEVACEMALRAVASSAQTARIAVDCALIAACAHGRSDLAHRLLALDAATAICEAFVAACEGGHEHLAFELFMRISPRGESRALFRALLCGAKHATICHLLIPRMTPAQHASLTYSSLN